MTTKAIYTSPECEVIDFSPSMILAASDPYTEFFDPFGAGEEEDWGVITN